MSQAGSSERATWAHQLGQQVDAEAHVGREDDGRLLRRLGQRLAAGGVDAGGADDMGLARCRRELRMGQARLRRGEIEHRIGRRKDLASRRRRGRGPSASMPASSTQILAEIGANPCARCPPPGESPGVVAARRNSRRPMRPPAPTTPIRQSFMSPPPTLRWLIHPSPYPLPMKNGAREIFYSSLARLGGRGSG